MMCMINANEHKKFLEQITELERNSVNYFDVEKEFFLIDSYNLFEVQTKLYGYSIQRTGIYQDDNLTPEAVAGLDGRGCYVYVEVKDGKITIKQDLNGCWGIYLFRYGDYFALSNSFFRLIDRVKFKYPLTVNRDYCNQLMAETFASITRLETPANEVQLCERNAVIYIDMMKKTIEKDFIDYKENTISLDSAESITVLDKWAEFWSEVLRGVDQQTSFIQVDLSGGFDSRTAFTSVLNSGIDLNKVRFFSKQLKNHTFPEDYAIASKIAQHYGFKLNQPFPEDKILNNSLFDVFNIDFHVSQLFHKSASLLSNFSRSYHKRYVIGGYGGESIRPYRLFWYYTPDNFLQMHAPVSGYFSSNLRQELSSSVEKVSKDSFRFVRDKYKFEDENSRDIPQYAYQETQGSYHWGKFTLNEYFNNYIRLAPLIDPDLRTLKLSTKECPDLDLLVALNFIRYQPNLLNFPFDSSHSIAPETIEYAKKINELFPLAKKDKISISSGGGISSAAA